MEERSSLVNWRKGHSGPRRTVSTEANIALVQREFEGGQDNSPFVGAPTLRRNGLNIARSTAHDILKKYLKFR